MVLIWLVFVVVLFFFISKACMVLDRNPLLGSFLAYFSSNGCHQDALFCHCELFLFPTVNCFGFHLWQITFHIYKRSFFWYLVERLLFISNIDFGKCEVIVLNKKYFFFFFAFFSLKCHSFLRIWKEKLFLMYLGLTHPAWNCSWWTERSKDHVGLKLKIHVRKILLSEC